MTKQEKLQAEAAIYGLDRNNMTPQGPQFSYDEIERMRAILQAHDKQNQGGSKEFDLNNPPKGHYVHQPFPQLVYHNSKREHKAVNNQEELQAAVASGEWNTETYGVDPALAPYGTDPSGAPMRGPADAGLNAGIIPPQAQMGLAASGTGLNAGIAPQAELGESEEIAQLDRIARSKRRL